MVRFYYAPRKSCKIGGVVSVDVVKVLRTTKFFCDFHDVQYCPFTRPRLGKKPLQAFIAVVGSVIGFPLGRSLACFLTHSD